MDKQCNEFIKVIHGFKRSSCKLRTSSLAPSEFFMLATIQHIGGMKKVEGTEEGAKVSDISEKIETSKPDVSKKLKSLEEKQLVIRVPGKKDKRVTYIQLSDKGSQLLEESKRESEQFISNVLKRIGEDDTREFMRLCKRMQEAMKEEMEEKKEKEGQ